MRGNADAQPPETTRAERTRRRARRVAVAWTLVVVTASLVDPASLLELVGASPTAGAGTGGASLFAVAHLVAYGVLAWLLVDALGSDARDPWTILAAIVIASTVGVGVELLQLPVAARTASVADALVNVVGATAGAAVRAAVGTR